MTTATAEQIPGQTDLLVELSHPARDLPATAEQRAQAAAGARRAHDAAEEAWKQQARTVTLNVAERSARTGEPFCSNDIWAAGLADPPGDRRALGHVLRRLAGEGRIRKVGSGAVSKLGHGSQNNSWWAAA